MSYCRATRDTGEIWCERSKGVGDAGSDSTLVSAGCVAFIEGGTPLRVAIQVGCRIKPQGIGLTQSQQKGSSPIDSCQQAKCVPADRVSEDCSSRDHVLVSTAATSIQAEKRAPSYGGQH